MLLHREERRCRDPRSARVPHPTALMEKSSVSLRCLECGASLAPACSCQGYFHALLALEAEVPGGPGGEPHFFAVASYNLQHPSAFVPAALLGLHRTLADVLASRATTADALRRARWGSSGSTRVRRRLDAELSASDQELLRHWPTRWTLTVRDALDGGVSQYAEHVRAWASATVRALDPITRPHSPANRR